MFSVLYTFIFLAFDQLFLVWFDYIPLNYGTLTVEKQTCVLWSFISVKRPAALQIFTHYSFQRWVMKTALPLLCQVCTIKETSASFIFYCIFCPWNTLLVASMQQHRTLTDSAESSSQTGLSVTLHSLLFSLNQKHQISQCSTKHNRNNTSAALCPHHITCCLKHENMSVNTAETSRKGLE